MQFKKAEERRHRCLQGFHGGSEELVTALQKNQDCLRFSPYFINSGRRWSLSQRQVGISSSIQTPSLCGRNKNMGSESTPRRLFPISWGRPPRALFPERSALSTRFGGTRGVSAVLLQQPVAVQVENAPKQTSYPEVSRDWHQEPTLCAAPPTRNARAGLWQPF